MRQDEDAIRMKYIKVMIKQGLDIVCTTHEHVKIQNYDISLVVNKYDIMKINNIR